MNPKIKEMWIEALESGEYKQGHGQLEKDGQFCCLGVLCDLAIKDGVEVERKIDTVTGNMLYDGCTGILPASVYHWAEVQSSPKVDGFHLWEWNDTVKLSFKQLAQKIRDSDLTT